MLLTSRLSGSTILVGEDNEDGAHSGKPDGDIDRFITNILDNYPIEVRLDISEEQLSQESAILAIKAYDVDEESGEIDTVYWNDVEIGRLSGTNGSWNITVLEVPLDLVKSGSNYVEITISTGWRVKIDWLQLLLDGGETDDALQSFSLELGEPSTKIDLSGKMEGLLLPVTTHIQTTEERQYETEYMLLDQNGNSVASAFGKAEGSGSITDEVKLDLPVIPSGTYRVKGFLKSAISDGEKIWAQDEVNWYYADGNQSVQVPAVKVSASPSGKASRSVTLTFTAIPQKGMTIERISAAELSDSVALDTNSLQCTLTENLSDVIELEIQCTSDGTPRKLTIPIRVEVDNIDRIAPEITGAHWMDAMEGTSNEEVRKQVMESLSITDDISEGGNKAYAGIADVRCEMNSENISFTGGSVHVTAVDYAGNTSSKTIGIQPRFQPLQLGVPTAQRQGGTAVFDLRAQLIATGGLSVVETGFVWGVMQNPTTTLNNGRTASPEPAGKGDTIAAEVSVVDGVNYYARAYLKTKGTTYYSQQVRFSVGAKDYGTISICNNGDNTFTVSRDGTDGAQTVYYRTVNGSAVGGTHFTHQTGSVTIADKEKTADTTITIAEQGVNAAHDEKPATGYSNAPRTYQVEIYRVEGGAAIGDESRATRTMDGNRTVNRSLFDEYSVNGTQADTQRGDYEEDGYGWTKGKYGKNSSETARVNRDGDGYWQHTAESIRYYLTFDAWESDKGYQAIQIVPGTQLDTTIYPYQSGIQGEIDKSKVLYAALFEHGKSDLSKTPLSYRFPDDGSFPSASSTLTLSLYHSGQSGAYVAFPVDVKNITAGFGASGDDGDLWWSRNVVHHIQVYDATEPQLLGIAPLADSTYKPGDTVTLSLVFDEIVDEENSGDLDLVVLETTWGEFAYAGGADTNVLYFTGKVPPDAAGDITVTRIRNAHRIKDMCEPSTTATSGAGSVGASVNTTVPAVTITAQPVTNGTAGATVTVEHADTRQYVWTEDTALPVNGWQDFESGDLLSTRQEAGSTWYLHILAQYNVTGATTHKYQEFFFPATPAAALPTLEASADNSSWAQARTIRLSYTPETATVTMTDPDGQLREVTGDQTVTRNGWYSFVLTSGDETISQAVEVTRIDREAPAVEELRQPSASSIPLESLSFSAVFSDEGSGVQKVEYCFDSSDTVPASGWRSASPSAGRYFFSYQAKNEQPETVYLHLRAADHVGNTVEKTSGGYVVQAPATGELTVSLSDAPADWRRSAQLIWSLGGKTGDSPFTLYGISDQGAQSVSDLSGTLAVARNGLYTVAATDSRGRTGQASRLVNRIDTQAPSVSEIRVPSGWATQKTIALVGLSDAMTPIYDEEGRVTHYDGSGVAEKRFKTLGADDGAATEIDGDSFVITENGSYLLILTDRLGNESWRLFTVTGIDTAAPRVTPPSLPQSWQPDPVEITLAVSDEGSGVRSIKTAFTASRDVPDDSALREQPYDSDAQTVTVTTANSADRYLYYRVTDGAGNVTDGFCGEIYTDTGRPEIDAVRQMPGLESQRGKAVLEMVTQDSASGITRYYSADGEHYQALTSNMVTLGTPGRHYFKVVNGAGTESDVEEVVLCQVDFSTGGADALPFHLVLAGETVIPPQAPSRTGYRFTGWQKDGEAYRFDDAVTGDLTLAAGWELEPPLVSIHTSYDGSAEPFVYHGGDLLFGVSATHPVDGIRYTYQWHDENGNGIYGANGQNYAVSAADAGEYRYSCTVTATDRSGLSSTSSQTAAVSIRRQTVAVPDPDGRTFTYNGRPQTYAVASDPRYTVRGSLQTAAGDHTVTVSLVDTVNYQWDSDETAALRYTFVIQKAPVRFEVSDWRHDYDAAEQAAGVNPQTDVAGLTVSEEDYTVHYEQGGRAVSPVGRGSYDIVVTLKNENLIFADEDDSLRKQKVGTLEILGAAYPHADAMTWPQAAALTYGQALGESPLTGGDQEGAGRYAWKSPDTIPTVESDGHIVVFTPRDPNYFPVEHTIKIEVAPRELTVADVEAQTRDYAPDNTAVTLSGGSLVGIVIRDGKADDVTLDGTNARGRVQAPDAGRKLPVLVSGYVLAGADAANYTLRQPGDVTVEITPAEGTGSVSMADWTYGEAASLPAVTSETNGTGSVTYRYTGTLADGTTLYASDDPPTDAGSYRVEAVFAATNNYREVRMQSDFTVNRRPILITWNKLDAVYCGFAQAPEITALIDVREADRGRVLASAEASAQTDAGSYDATARLSGERAENYTLRNGTETFVIRPAPVTFQVTGNSIRYDGEEHTAQVTAEALGQEFSAFSVRYQTADGETANPPVEAGRYQILAALTDFNYRHSGAKDGAERQIGVLEIYRTDAPAVYSVTFLPGAEDVSGSLPVLPDSTAGSFHFLPDPGELEREGYRFAGWEYGGKIYDAHTEFLMPARDVTFTAVWAASPYEIGGSVVWGESDDPKPAGDVLVTLMRGNQQISQMTTAPDGSFTFRQVTAGVYNLIARYGEIVQTKKIELIGQNPDPCILRLPLGKTNSVLTVLDGAPDVVVGNLEKLFFGEPDEVIYTEADRVLVGNGGTVEIRMTADAVSPAADSPMDQAFNRLPGGFWEGITLNLTLDKCRKDAGGKVLDNQPITEANLLIEIVVPLDGALQDRDRYRVLREHEGTVDEIGISENAEGEYYILHEDRRSLTIFAKRFSLYSVFCSDDRSGNGGGDGGGESIRPKPQPETEKTEDVRLTPVPEPAGQPIEAEKADIAPPARPEETPSSAAAPPAAEEPLRQEVERADEREQVSLPVELPALEKPFVLLNAVGTMLSVALALLRKSRGKSRWLAMGCAAGALAITLLTIGWYGIVAADIWTIPVAALTLLVFRLSGRTQA